jgi:uncharacterized protein YbjT (DUF2867 family)
LRERVLVAGATGAVGKRLVPLLVAEGYQVFGTTRFPGKVSSLERAGRRGCLRSSCANALGR